MTPLQKRRVALVTGSVGGIGAAIVQLFLENNWAVLGVDREEHKHPITDAYSFVRADLSRERDLERVVKAVRRHHSRLDAIVNNAAVQIVKPLADMTTQDWADSMAVNLIPAGFLPSRMLDLLEASEGAVVNVASIHAVATSAGMAAYVASKGALVGLTRAMALEFAPRQIRVNAVLPGAINTPMLAEGLKRSKGSLKRLASKHPLKRIGTPIDVAQAVLFLSDSLRAPFITGQTLIVDGGATAHLSTE